MSNIFAEQTSKISKAWSGFKKLREANAMSQHFSNYLTPVVANTPELKNTGYNIRHTVYCDELKFEPPRENRLETDEFDCYSVHCLLAHVQSDTFAGTVRMVRPKRDNQPLPIEKYCLDSITNKELSPVNFKRTDICEISRLAVPAIFRRRRTDKHSGAALGVINTETYSEQELRCFPFIAVGLYLTAAAVALQSNIQHAYVMMEPRLAQSMRFIGIKFEKLGPTIEYHGQRAPFYINQPLLYKNLTPGFKVMLNNIQAQLGE